MAVAFCYLKSYEVAPSQAAWSGWTNVNEPNNWVGNTFTCNFDSIVEAQFFAGDVGGGGQYRVIVQEYPSGTPVTQSALASASGSHTWVKLSGWNPVAKFTRGRTYLAKVVRPNDSINFYWSESVPGGPWDSEI